MIKAAIPANYSDVRNRTELRTKLRPSIGTKTLTLFPGAMKFSSEGFNPKKLLLPGFPKSMINGEALINK